MTASRRVVDLVIPALDEERRLPVCFAAIEAQVLDGGVEVRVRVADGGSRDRTREIARAHGAEILDNSLLKDPEAAKMLGLRAAEGDYLMFVDADMTFAHPRTLQQLVEALDAHPQAAGAIGRYALRRSDPPVNRALSMDPMQCDPVYAALVPGFPAATGLYAYTREIDIPPFAGTTLYRRAALAGVVATDVPRYYDVDVPLALFRAGYVTWAVVPAATFFHEHAVSLKQLVRKRLRNLDNGRGNGLLTEQPVPRLYRWIAPARFGAAQFALRLLIAMTGVGLVPRAAALAVRHRDPAALLLPVLGPLVGTTLLYGLLRSAGGRTLLRRALT
jgi:glycosyltransferase involved in cell wall biosynthesis